jgi:hypothetical protein
MQRRCMWKLINTYIHYMDSRWRKVVISTPADLTMRKATSVQITNKADWEAESV